MNEIAKQATADRFLSALRKEHLSKKEAGDSVDLTPVQVSYLFNKNYWSRLGNTGWDKVLKWVNSGLPIKEYHEKHKHDAKLEIIIDEFAKEGKLSKLPDAIIDKKEELPPTVKTPARHPSLATLLEEEKARLQAAINHLQMRIHLIEGLLPHYK